MRRSLTALVVLLPAFLARGQMSWSDYAFIQREHVAHMYLAAEKALPVETRRQAWFQAMKLYVRISNEGSCVIPGSHGSSDIEQRSIDLCLVPNAISAQFGIAVALIKLSVIPTGYQPGRHLEMDTKIASDLSSGVLRTQEHYTAEMKESLVNPDFVNCSPQWVARWALGQPVGSTCKGRDPENDEAWVEKMLITKLALHAETNDAKEIYRRLAAGFYSDMYLWTISHELGHFILAEREGLAPAATLEDDIALEEQVDVIAEEIRSRVSAAEDIPTGSLAPFFLWGQSLSSLGERQDNKIARHASVRGVAFLRRQACRPDLPPEVRTFYDLLPLREFQKFCQRKH